MIPGQGSLSRLGLSNRDAGPQGEVRERGFGALTRIGNTAASDDQRCFRFPEQVGELIELARVWTGRANGPEARLEETGWIVERLGLDVLAESQRHRPATRRIEQSRQRTGQGIEQLLGTADPVE